MKKGFLSTAIVLWVIIAVAIVFAAIFINNGGLVNSKVLNNITVKETLIKNENISLGNAQNIVIEGTKQSIEIRKTTGDSINVSQYGDPKTKSEELFRISTTDDVIRVFIDKKTYVDIFNFNSFNEKLVVEIPSAFYGNLEAKTSSGSVRTEDEFALKKVQLHTSSGSIRTKEKLTADTLDAGTSSGSLHLGNVYVDSYDLRCSSGSIKVDGISGGGNATTSSGSINIALINPKGNVDLNVSSGSISISLESSLEFTLDARTSSGRIHTNFAANKNERGNHATASIGNNPVVNINATTSSGSIRVEK